MRCDKRYVNEFLVLYFRIIPDSPRWYLRKGQIQEAKDIILEGARINKLSVPENVDSLLELQSAAL